MKKDKLNKIAKSTLLVSALTLGVNIVANDITPGSWEAHAMSKKSVEKEAEKKCGAKDSEKSCGAKAKQEKGKTASCSKKSCGADKKKMKKSKKGSDGSCGKETCGA